MDLELLWVLGSLATVGIGGYAAVRLVNLFLGRMEGKLPGVTEELDELRARVDELEAERARVTELEERVDFTERVLAGEGQSRKLEASS